MKGKKITEGQKQEIVSLMRSNGAVVGYLFGSYARGTAGPLSDIDVAVAFPRTMPKETQEDRIEDIRYGLEKRFGGRDKADVVNLPKLRNPLLRYIIALGEGRVLFADDVSIRNGLAYRALLEYEDTKPLRAIQSMAVAHLFS